jgi:hypothetical protein
MKKPILLLLLLPAVIALTSFKRIPGYTVTVDNTTSATDLNVFWNYYDASHNLLASHEKSVPHGTEVSDSGPSPFSTTASITISLSAGVCTLDFWNSAQTWSGGCVSNYPSATVTSASFDFTTSYLSYLLYADNGACR